MLKRLATVFGILTIFVAMPAISSIIMLSGDTVDFFYDDAQPGMAAYGNLSVIGNSIFATPTDFIAQGLNGGSDTFLALGTVRVVAKAGYSFDALQIAQNGDYKLVGAGSAVTSQGLLNIVNNTHAIADINTTLLSTDDFTINNGLLHNWSSSKFVDLTAGSWLGTSSIDLNLMSTLTADSLNTGSIAFIQNKFVGGGLVTVVTSEVPVPASIWLFISGIMTLFGVSYKRK